MGRAIGAWHRGAARTACLADLRRAVRNIVGGYKVRWCRYGEVERWMELVLGFWRSSIHARLTKRGFLQYALEKFTLDNGTGAVTINQPNIFS